ncbi:MAG: Flp pilus assembly protein TadD, partial [Myxococcota bacterium]
DYARAEAHFREAIARDPSPSYFWTNLGASLMEQGKLGEAEAILLGEALPREPGSPDAVLNLAGVYLKAGRPDKALEQIDGVLMRGDHPRAASMRVDALAPDAWVLLSGQHLMEGDLVASEQVLQRAIALGADPIEVGLNRSALLLRQERGEEAFQLLKALQQQAPEDARIPFNIGIAVVGLAGPELARGWFERAAALAPEWAAPREQLALLPAE